MTDVKHNFRRITVATCFSLAVLLFAVIFGWLLPPEYFTENGPVELIQAGVLAITALVSFSALFQRQLAMARRKLFAMTSVIWLLCVARELSWGRVFYITGTGQIPPLKSLWFGSWVYPSIAVIIIAAGVYFFAEGLHKELLIWLKDGKLPVLDFCIFAIALVLADLVEHHSFGIFGANTDLFEELGESVSYIGALSFMINVIFDKRYRTNHTLLSKENRAM